MNNLLVEYYRGLLKKLENPSSGIFSYWQRYWKLGDREFRDTIFPPYREVVLKEEPLHDLILTHPLKNLEIDLGFATLVGYEPQFIDKANRKTQWAPMNLRNLRKILNYVNENFGFEGKIFYSLGCGDARECIMAELLGAEESIGVELNKKMYQVAEVLTLSYKVKLLRSDFFDVDLSDADIIFFNAYHYHQEDIEELFHSIKDGAILILTENNFGKVLKTFKVNMTDDQPEYIFNVNICKK